MSSLTPSRRTVLRTAAWSVPAVTVATAAPAFAASSPPGEPTYQDVTRDFVYDARLGGAAGPVIGQIEVSVTATVPLVAPVGSTLAPTQTTSTVTIPASLADLLKTVYLPGATQIEGTSVSTSALSGAINGATVANLTIPMTQLPPNGQPLVTVASGQSEAPMEVPAGNPTGTVVITMGEPQSQLVGFNADGTATGGVYDSVLFKREGSTDADYQLATFEVVA